MHVMGASGSMLMVWLMILVNMCNAGGPLRSIFPKADGYTLQNGQDPGKPIFLTPYIEKGDIQLARNLSRVGQLNGTSVTSYSGFLTVNSTYNSNMFFWLFPAESAHPEEFAARVVVTGRTWWLLALWPLRRTWPIWCE